MMNNEFMQAENFNSLDSTQNYTREKRNNCIVN